MHLKHNLVNGFGSWLSRIGSIVEAMIASEAGSAG
jgi:hypothetical protein